MLSTADLTGMRATLEASLPDSAEVHRRTPVSDGAGGTIDTWAPVGTYDARLSPAVRSDRMAEVVVAGAVAAISTWILTLPYGADITEQDRVFVDGRQFEVGTIFAPRSFEIGRRMFAQEIE